MLEIAGSFAGKEFNKMVGDAGEMQTEERGITIAEEYDLSTRVSTTLSSRTLALESLVCSEYRWMGRHCPLPLGNEGMGYNFVCVESVKFDPSLWTVENRGKSHALKPSAL
jgi:hypothetical protein